MFSVLVSGRCRRVMNRSYLVIDGVAQLAETARKRRKFARTPVIMLRTKFTLVLVVSTLVYVPGTSSCECKCTIRIVTFFLFYFSSEFFTLLELGT